jgi:site-specific DNA-methyltransferase (adenine-specific)
MQKDMTEINKIYNEDCLITMSRMEDNSVDLLLQDTPYNMTGCDWDEKVDLSSMWKEWLRVAKKNAALIFTAKQPFTTDLINSNREMFRYEMIWFKDRATGFLNAGSMPMPNHENILVFYREPPAYNPQTYNGKKSHSMGKTANTKSKTKVYGDFVRKENLSEEKMPKTVLYYPQPYPQIHNTQKPIDLFRYLIRTYSNEGDLVFDGYVGSGTTAIAAIMEKRQWIVCENKQEYFDNAQNRIKTLLNQPTLF